jgi:hypothetical protein
MGIATTAKHRRPRRDPAEPVLCPFTIAVDTREQDGWRFTGIVDDKGRPLAVMMPVEKAESIRRAARLRLGAWLARPNAAKTDVEAMAVASEARRAARISKRGR